MILLILSVYVAVSYANLIQTPEDGRLNFTQLTAKYGRASEEFDLVTEDGYILKLFHIRGNEGKPPVLCMHGLGDSADTYVLRGKTSIAMILAEAGYDVWVGNDRGNMYSQRHVTLSPENREFWDFSFHEMGVYDLPATIDFILGKTGKEKLSAIGHSRGTTIFYILGSERPEYNNKLSVFISLAPIAYLNNLEFGTMMVIRAYQASSGFLNAIGYEDEFQKDGITDDFAKLVCGSDIGYELCVRVLMTLIIGPTEEIEPEFLEVVLNHFPDGMCWKDLKHFIQVIDSGRFAQYDYDIFNTYISVEGISMEKELPPAYKLHDVTMPVALIVGANDTIAKSCNAKILKAQLPNVIHYQVIDNFDHADFVWAKHLKEFLMPVIEEILRKFA